MKKQHTPQLHFGKNKCGQDCWKLSTTEGRCAIELQICYYHDDPEGMNHYRVMVGDIHDIDGYRELLIREGVDSAYHQIQKNEGIAKAEEWIANLNHEFFFAYESHYTHRIANELKQRWEAMLTLGLFTPHVTH